MTPKEKAQELVGKYVSFAKGKILFQLTMESAKQCALIAVDELINEVYNISHQYTAVYDITTMTFNYEESKELKFWQDVKQEIQKL